MPELDGVRGLAVLMTVAMHWQAAIRPGTGFDRVVVHVAAFGWLGVEIFFVLSGYLITGILMRARAERPRFRSYLGRFMWRRALRIMPLYYAGVAVFFFVLPAVFTIRDPAYWAAHESQAWYWLFGVNWKMAIDGAASAPFLTSHFWSVAVEEQFYLVWPLLVWWTDSRRLPWLAVALWIGSIVARVPFAPSAAYPWHAVTPLHLDGLMAGALLAWCATTGAWPSVAAVLRRLTIPALCLMVISILADSTMPALNAVALGTLMVATLTGSANGWRAICRASWLRRFGTYSYCIYLVHFPLEALLQRVLPRLGIPEAWGSTMPYGAVFGVLLLGISTGVAAVSWRYFEQPLLTLKDARWTRKL